MRNIKNPKPTDKSFPHTRLFSQAWRLTFLNENPCNQDASIIIVIGFSQKNHDQVVCIPRSFGSCPKRLGRRSHFVCRTIPHLVGHTRDQPWSMSQTLFDLFVALLDNVTDAAAIALPDDDEQTRQDDAIVVDEQLQSALRALYNNQCLAKHWNSASDCNVTSWSVTDQIMDLHHRGLLKGLKDPVSANIYCTYQGDLFTTLPVHGWSPSTDSRCLRQLMWLYLWARIPICAVAQSTRLLSSASTRCATY